ncbi:nucleotidyltransferase family protein [Peribacillus alkalitolerans]|uniref:nucleotidyltransferase family protein n=1 Tax=Peribacillus alkalitolerans TaxID=1550385 RepID=UPI0013D6D2A9|nr:nucleotidyltransferase family protein [Peribacillus alkalitolerans]
MERKRIVGIYLAAGSSNRMGCNKLSLPFEGSFLGSKALITALQSKLDTIFVITTPEDPMDWIAPSLFFNPVFKGKWTRIVSEKSFEGQAESLKSGLKEAENYLSEAAIVLLADQPFITTEMINNLILKYKECSLVETKLHYITSSNNGMFMPPLLLTSHIFSDIIKLNGDHGARYLIRDKDRYNGLSIDYTETNFFYDIDTPNDYDEITKNK